MSEWKFYKGKQQPIIAAIKEGQEDFYYYDYKAERWIGAACSVSTMKSYPKETGWETAREISQLEVLVLTGTKGP